MPTVIIAAEPAPIALDLERTALVVIDMQRDFLEPGGFGETLGKHVSLLAAAVEPCHALLTWARAQRMLVIHTREGHRPDLSDAPKAKLERGKPKLRIGDPGPMGRILIRGKPGHEIIEALCPIVGEPVIDKLGKGAFYATMLGSLLTDANVENLIVCGVTTEVCVHTTVREANDRGFRCLVPGDCCASYFPHFHEVGLEMIQAQGGIFGWSPNHEGSLRALERNGRTTYAAPATLWNRPAERERFKCARLHSIGPSGLPGRHTRRAGAGDRA